MSADEQIRVTYQDIHILIGETAERIKKEYQPDLFIAIGGGGFFPARVLRTFLKNPARKNIPIQAIGLSLYEDLANPSEGDKIGKEVVRTQWLDFSTLGSQPLAGRKILIVDEVDDSRTTLGYAISELLKDVAIQAEKMANGDEKKKKELIDATEFGIFVVHNKLKEKLATLPPQVRYFSGQDVPDVWVHYPWEQVDIYKHDAIVALQKAKLGKTEVTIA